MTISPRLRWLDPGSEADGGPVHASLHLATSASLRPGDDLTGGTWYPDPADQAGDTVGFTRLTFDRRPGGGLGVLAELPGQRFAVPVLAEDEVGPGHYSAPFLDGWMALATTLGPDGPRLHVEVIDPATGDRAEGCYLLDERGRHAAGDDPRATPRPGRGTGR